MVGGIPGLGLQVGTSGSRSWILRHTVDGRRRDMELGGFPEGGLAEVRDRARGARSSVWQGVNPIDAAKAARSAEQARQRAARTFAEVARACIAAKAPGWRNTKHAEQWTATPGTYAFPLLGGMIVGDIERTDVQQVLAPLWATKTETATRLRGRIETVLGYAIALGMRAAPNPAAWKHGLDAVLPNPRKVARGTHHNALPYSQISAFMKRLRAAEGQGARALELAILCASRSGEVRGATWGEFDLEAAKWNIPGERMKAGKPHRVPLSPAAIALLERLPRTTDDDLVFRGPVLGPDGNAKPLSDMTLTAVLRRMKVDAVPHGFRSSFRTWIAEQTSFPREIAEAALAHAVESEVERAYQRGDLLEKRRRLMGAWADYCAGASSTKPVSVKARSP